jgi:hypothetical protein
MICQKSFGGIEAFLQNVLVDRLVEIFPEKSVEVIRSAASHLGEFIDGDILAEMMFDILANLSDEDFLMVNLVAALEFNLGKSGQQGLDHQGLKFRSYDTVFIKIFSCSQFPQRFELIYQTVEAFDLDLETALRGIGTDEKVYAHMGKDDPQEFISLAGGGVGFAMNGQGLDEPAVMIVHVDCLAGGFESGSSLDELDEFDVVMIMALVARWQGLTIDISHRNRRRFRQQHAKVVPAETIERLCNGLGQHAFLSLYRKVHVALFIIPCLWNGNVKEKRVQDRYKMFSDSQGPGKRERKN